ncbi:MAG: carbohydrate ABC transporter permease [Clostridiaceae bacterium]|nr:carbohydrate ABC transporter permease [Clostridiaceae bacterium]
MLKRSRGEKIFNVFNVTFFTIFAMMLLVPVLYVLKQSLDIERIGELSLSLFPRKFSLVFYQMIINDRAIYRTFLNSAYITVVGTALSVFLNAMGAYALARRDLPGNRFFIYYLVILPMLFSGGLIPTYLVVKSLGLIDKLAALIIPALVSGWNMALIRNYYWSIPPSLSESARIDGAEEFTVFFRIILPLSKPVIAAIALFTGVGFWNTFFSAVIYINSPQKYTFPVKLRELILVQYDMQRQFTEALQLRQMQGSGDDLLLASLTQEGLSGAIIVVSMLPIIIVYPYLQKYFTKGIMVGSLKG